MNEDATQLAQKAIAKNLVEKPELEAKSKSEGELARRSSSETKEDNYMKAAVALSGVIAAIAGVASAPVAAGIAVGRFDCLVSLVPRVFLRRTLITKPNEHPGTPR